MFATTFKSVAAAATLAATMCAMPMDAKAWGTGYSYSYSYYDYYDAYDYYGYSGAIDYYPAAPYVEEYVYVAPAPVVVYDERPAPWTDEWYDYCSWKYRSFDPASGTFQPYRGGRRLCR